ncbi:YceI family protein [Maribellus sp. YY47]|uniref:YceI family protein n=1 Tax=Maribellus sp. YY47 TaxID=2929486 RepID=UPI002000A950|nr:YceI family protein [Maribellus sp. YY47]MCK3683795.1 YceI family protein [Maribellus sp. YY47]
MKKITFKSLIVSLLLLSIQATVSGQTTYQLAKDASKITILGTSSVHDWTVEVDEFKCDVSIALDDNSNAAVSGVNVICEVKNIESDNRIMTGKIYKALEGDDHPQITFKVADAVNVANGTESAVKGQLTIAGQTKAVSLPFKLVSENGSTIKIEGKVPLKMSDFKIDPPTAMMGALKTGDDIEIAYSIVLTKK